MTTPKIIRFAHRKGGRVTSRMVADRFGLNISHASAFMCNLARDGKAVKQLKVRGAGVRWYWVFRVRKNV